VRIADVARASGVSKAAVSFAFNNPARLKPATAERIKDIAAAMGYRPHPVARMLTARSTATIGILSPQALAQVFANPFFALFAEGIATVIEDRGSGLLTALATSGGDAPEHPVLETRLVVRGSTSSVPVAAATGLAAVVPAAALNAGAFSTGAVK